MDIQNLLDHISPEFYWLFIFLSSFIENIFPPYPGDTVTVLGAYLVGVGRLSLEALITSVFLGSLSGAIVMYFFGQNVISFFGNTLRIKAMNEFVEEGGLKKTHKWFEKYGVVTIILSRFSAGIRFFVSIVAGATNMNLFVFIFAFSLGTVIWNAFLIYGGYTLGDNWSEVLDILKIYNWIIISVISAAVIAFFLRKFFKRKKAN